MTMVTGRPEHLRSALRLPRYVEVETSRCGQAAGSSPTGGDEPAAGGAGGAASDGAGGAGVVSGRIGGFGGVGGNEQGGVNVVDAIGGNGGIGGPGTVGGAGRPGWMADDGGGKGPLGGGGPSRRGTLDGRLSDGRSSDGRSSDGRSSEGTPEADQDLMAWPLFDKIVRELGDLGYAGWWAFHHCSEPLLNPRLIREVQHVRALVPQARPAIHTNGDLLTPGLLVDLLCLGTGYVRITRYPRADAPDVEPAHEPVRQWLLAGGLLDSLPWRFVELAHGWAAVFERDGLRVDVIRPRLPAGAAHGPAGNHLPLTTTRGGGTCRGATPTAASIDCTGRVAMCRSVFGDAPACGRHTIGNLRERSFADLWSSPTLSAHREDPEADDWAAAPAGSF
jgi:hypothetical protein